MQEENKVVILAGWWLPDIEWLNSGPRVGSVAVVSLNDQGAIDSLMERAIQLLSKWPIMEIEFVPFEEFNQNSLNMMAEKVKQSYREWYTPENWKAYCERMGYELRKNIPGYLDRGDPERAESEIEYREDY